MAHRPRQAAGVAAESPRRVPSPPTRITAWSIAPPPPRSVAREEVDLHQAADDVRCCNVNLLNHRRPIGWNSQHVITEGHHRSTRQARETNSRHTDLACCRQRLEHVGRAPRRRDADENRRNGRDREPDARIPGRNRNRYRSRSGWMCRL